MKKHYYTALLALGVITPAFAQTAATQPPNQPAQTAQAEKAQGVWIDVRTPEEFAEGHISDAINIPVDQIEKRISEVTQDKDAPINLYCRTGRRAGVALDTLKSMGYTNVTNHGGYQSLVEKGIK